MWLGSSYLMPLHRQSKNSDGIEQHQSFSIPVYLSGVFQHIKANNRFNPDLHIPDQRKSFDLKKHLLVH